MGKPDAHAVQHIGKGNGWACGFGRCTQDAPYLILEWRGGERSEKGACLRCATRWAEKDKCEPCLRVIQKYAEKEDSSSVCQEGEKK